MKIKILLLLAITLFSHMSVSDVTAQSVEAVELKSVVILGTRTSGRSVVDSMGPVDIISEADVSDQAGSDMSDLISKVVPSYNVRATGDAASLVRPVSLRGLPSDASLVLLNGKRRHRAAVISFIGAGVSDGSQGPDISVIPSNAIRQLEILRDGASALYGSDAVAGVMNFILKEDTDGGSVDFKLGETVEGDGDFYQIGGNLGLPLTAAGFINTSFEYRQVQPFSRSVQTDDAAELIANGNSDVANPVQPAGSAEVLNDFKSFINMGIDLDDNREWYGFGNYAERKVETPFSFRNPNTRGGIFGSALNLAGAAADANGNAIPFLVDTSNTTITRAQIVDGNDVIRSDLADQGWVRRYDRLVADVTTDGASGNCPQTDANNNGGLNIYDTAGLAAVIANLDCFVYNGQFPGGFTPIFGSQLKDASLVTGLRGMWGYNATWDVSAGFGRNEADFYINNTVNASMGPDSPNGFRPGTYIQQEQSVNADFTYTINGEIEQHMAAGFEWREEQFEVIAGEESSWQPGTYDAQGFSIGSNGFSGFSPDVAGKWDQSNVSLYGDYEIQLTYDLLLGAAIRWEDFDTFGDTTNYKLSAGWKLTDQLSLRATHSTGFRAPTPGQSNISNITTLLDNGILIDRGTISPTNGIAMQYGGEALTPETSKNYNLGAVITLDRLQFFIDVYQIDFEDRITQSADIQLTALEAQALEDEGFSGAAGLRSFRFYVNDFNTTTRGVDVVATYPFSMMAGASELSLVYNYNTTEVTYFNPITLDDVRIRQIEDSMPRQRWNVSWRHAQGPWRTLFRVNYFSDYWLAHVGDINLAFEPGSEYTLDAEVAYSFGPNTAYDLVLGAENLFNNFPDANPHSGLTGAKYPENAPMGNAGGIYYARLSYNF
jgi:iron complex outermembrane receptor protein